MLTSHPSWTAETRLCGCLQAAIDVTSVMIPLSVFTESVDPASTLRSKPTRLQVALRDARTKEAGFLRESRR